ncbi:hypothetical protein IJH72_02850 [Candidatus Saccharibacteria bacterium]|nr:hypothetical protein [Candidatus Saccharibacteria bacterium]
MEQNEIPINQIIKKYEKTYKRLTPIKSPAINEDIYFNMPGFKHLIFKNKHRRPNKVIYSRMVLIPLIKPVICNCQKPVEKRILTEKIEGKTIKVTYYALEARVGKSSTRVRVVVKKNRKKW